MTDYKVQWGGTLPGGVAWTTGLGVTSSQPPAALLTTMEAALTDMWTNGTYGLGNQYAPGITLTQVEVITVDGTFKQTSKVIGPLALVGTSGDAPLTNDDTMTIRKENPGLARWQRGFMSLPAPVEGTLVNGKYTVPTRDRFGAALQAVRSAITADGSTVYIHTPASKPGTTYPPYTKTVVTKLAASDKPGSRRQRTRKVKPSYS